MSGIEQEQTPFDPSEHAFHFIPQPDLDNLSFGQERLAKVGEVPIATANWGYHLTAEQIKESFAKRGLLTDNDVSTIDNSGFSGGWHLDPEIDPGSEEIQEDSALRVAALVERLVKVRGWKGVDHLAIASVSLRKASVQRVKEILDKRGISVERTQFYHIACAGGTTIIGDAASSEDLQGKRVIGLGQEVLSGTFVDPNDATMNHTFGIGEGGIAFIPGREIVHHFGDRLVKKDTGAIKIPRLNDLPPEEDRQPLPPMYRIANEETQEVFAIGSDGSVIMLMPTNEGLEHGVWIPRNAAKFFFKEGSDFLVSALRKLKDSGFDLEKLGTAIAHQATEKTNEGVLGFVRKKLERLQVSEGIEIPIIKIPWMLKEAGVNNMSAATSFFQALELATRGYIKKGEFVPVFGFAIGAFFNFDVIKFI